MDKLKAVLFFSHITVFILAVGVGYFLRDAEYAAGRAVNTSNKFVKDLIADKKEDSSTYLVTRVIDGDTFEIEGGEIVRYIGINTPETKDPRTKVQCYGKEAADENNRLIEGKKVRLEKDISEKDKYGRLLRYVYVDNVFINELLIRDGYANAATYPPDVKFQHLFTEAENEARENKRGLWEKCAVNM